MNNFIKDIKKVSKLLDGEVYIVGGYIREKLLKTKTNFGDLDIVYSKDIHEFIKELNKIGYYPFKIKENEEIYRIKFNNKFIDIASLKGKNIEEDLEKRDFTINSIALKLIDNKIIDPFKGRYHINNRLVHEVSENSIKDDKIRILRGYRFCVKYGMHFSSSCEESVKIQSKYIKEEAKERIFSELMNIIHSDNSGIAFDMMDKGGTLKYLLPYIDELKLVGKCKYHIEDVFTHMNLAYKNAKDIINGRIKINGLNKDIFNYKIGEYDIADYFAFATFCHDIGKFKSYKKVGDKVSFIGHEDEGQNIMKEVCLSLGFSKKGAKFIAMLVKGHMHPLGLCKNKVKNYKKSFYKLFSRYNEYMPYILALSYCDMHATKMLYDPNKEEDIFIEFLNKLFKEYELFREIKNNRLLNGNEIMNITNAKGIEVGYFIEEIDKKIFLGELKNREDIIIHLKNKNKE